MPPLVEIIVGNFMNALQLDALSFRDKAVKPTINNTLTKTPTPTTTATTTPKTTLDQDVINLAKAIREHETGNRQVAGATGELASRYQFMPATWKSEAKRILGDENAPLTLENENKVAYTRIKEWKDAGYNPAQIASMWNSGNPDMYAKGNNGVGQSSQNPNITYNVPKYVESVYSKYQQEKAKNPPQQIIEPTIQEEPKEPSYFDTLKEHSPMLRGVESITGGVGKALDFTSEKILRPTIGRAVGSVVENLGTGIGGAVGLVAGTGKELYDVAKGDKFSFKDIGQAVEQTAKSTGQFGREIGTEGGIAAPFAGAGKIPSAMIAVPSLYEGTKKMIQTKGQEGKTELAIGAAGLLGAKLSTGAWIDDPLKAMVKSGVNSPISKTAKVTDDIRSGYRSVLRPGKGEIMNIEVRQGKSIDNIIDFIAEEGVVIKATPDGKMDTLEAIDFLKQKQQEPNRVLNEILSTDKTKKFDLMESAEKAFKELETTIKNADELNARKKEVLEFIQAEIDRNGRYVDATTLNNIKSGMWSVGYNMGKPTSQSTARKLGHIMKESIEQNFPDQNIRNLNNLTGQYADALYMLKQAEGRVVPKGAIGQYVAQAIGAMAGSSVPLVGPLAGGWVGGKVGKYLASPERVTSKLMQKAQKAGIPKRSETIMKESIDAATKAKLQPKLPPLLEAGKSQSGAIQLPPLSQTGKAKLASESFVKGVPVEVTTGRNVGTGQFKEVYKSTPKLPPKTIQSLYGGAMGFEPQFDENGKFTGINYNPIMGALGVGGMFLGTKAKGMTDDLIDGVSKTKSGAKLPPSQPVYKESGNLTTKVLKDLEGKSTVSKQYILDATNRGELKQTERDLIRQILETEKGKDVDVVSFVNKVKTELLPLERKQMKNAGKVNNVKYGERQRYESISLPKDLRGNVANYDEIIYESPVKTSAGKTHFDGGTDNYFGHTRVEDMAGDKGTMKLTQDTVGQKVPADEIIPRRATWGDSTYKNNGTTRRVIEVQSDLYQKGNLEREYKSLFDRMDRSEKIKLSKIDKQIDSIDIASKKFDEAHKQRNMYLKEIENKYKGEVDRLQQYNDPTAHFRMVREEVKKAAEDGKTKLQFPTGETAMKIEGLAGRGNDNFLHYEDSRGLVKSDIVYGQKFNDRRYRGNGSGNFVILDKTGDETFKAVQLKYDAPEILGEMNYGDFTKEYVNALKKYVKENSHLIEEFSIAEKIDTNNPIYKFYEKDLGKYVTNKYGAKRIVDDKGVQWYEVDVKPEWAKIPVEAFGLGALGIGSQLIEGRKE